MQTIHTDQYIQCLLGMLFALILVIIVIAAKSRRKANMGNGTIIWFPYNKAFLDSDDASLISGEVIDYKNENDQYVVRIKQGEKFIIKGVYREFIVDKNIEPVKPPGADNIVVPDFIDGVKRSKQPVYMPFTELTGYHYTLQVEKCPKCGEYLNMHAQERKPELVYVECPQCNNVIKY